MAYRPDQRAYKKMQKRISDLNRDYVNEFQGYPHMLGGFDGTKQDRLKEINEDRAVISPSVATDYGFESGGKSRKKSKWNEYLADYRKKHPNLTFAEASKQASLAYKSLNKQGGSMMIQGTVPYGTMLKEVKGGINKDDDKYSDENRLQFIYDRMKKELYDGLDQLRTAMRGRIYLVKEMDRIFGRKLKAWINFTNKYYPDTKKMIDLLNKVTEIYNNLKQIRNHPKRQQILGSKELQTKLEQIAPYPEAITQREKSKRLLDPKDAKRNVKLIVDDYLEDQFFYEIPSLQKEFDKELKKIVLEESLLKNRMLTRKEMNKEARDLYKIYDEHEELMIKQRADNTNIPTASIKPPLIKQKMKTIELKPKAIMVSAKEKAINELPKPLKSELKNRQDNTNIPPPPPVPLRSEATQFSQPTIPKKVGLRSEAKKQAKKVTISEDLEDELKRKVLSKNKGLKKTVDILPKIEVLEDELKRKVTSRNAEVIAQRMSKLDQLEKARKERVFEPLNPSVPLDALQKAREKIMGKKMAEPKLSLEQELKDVKDINPPPLPPNNEISKKRKTVIGKHKRYTKPLTGSNSSVNSSQLKDSFDDNELKPIELSDEERADLLTRLDELRASGVIIGGSYKYFKNLLKSVKINKKPRKVSEWNKHVANVRKKNPNLSFKQAVEKAKKSYNATNATKATKATKSKTRSSVVLPKLMKLLKGL
jgi:hypothetical protein